MLSCKDSPRWLTAVAGASLAAGLLSETSAAAIPAPDPVARVPLIGLLPRWTWDPSQRPLPMDTGSEAAPLDEVDTALRFVAQLLADQGETVNSVSGYRLDDPQLVAVVAELAPRDEGGLRTTIALAFTVRATSRPDGTYDTQLVVEDR